MAPTQREQPRLEFRARAVRCEPITDRQAKELGLADGGREVLV